MDKGCASRLFVSRLLTLPQLQQLYRDIYFIDLGKVNIRQPTQAIWSIYPGSWGYLPGETLSWVVCVWGWCEVFTVSKAIFVEELIEIGFPNCFFHRWFVLRRERINHILAIIRKFFIKIFSKREKSEIINPTTTFYLLIFRNISKGTDYVTRMPDRRRCIFSSKVFRCNGKFRRSPQYDSRWWTEKRSS